MPGQPDTGKRIVSIQCRKSHFRRDTNDESPSSAKPKTTKPIRKPTALITVLQQSSRGYNVVQDDVGNPLRAPRIPDLSQQSVVANAHNKNRGGRATDQWKAVQQQATARVLTNRAGRADQCDEDVRQDRKIAEEGDQAADNRLSIGEDQPD
jgi:hypothetical protein